MRLARYFPIKSRVYIYTYFFYGVFIFTYEIASVRETAFLRDTVLKLTCECREKTCTGAALCVRRRDTRSGNIM